MRRILTHRTIRTCTRLSSPSSNGRSTLYALKRPASSQSDDLLKEGAEVEFITGGRGYLVEKNKGGWWKVAVNQSETATPLVVKVRTSAFRIAQNGATSAQLTTTPSSIDIALAGFTVSDDAPVLPVPFILPMIDPPERHRTTKSWVIFSDLHVKGSSIECCTEVLQKVHEAALERNAGIIFLGDFWHVRGALNVELLNTVLRSLRMWTQPVIMIPGNHDQVTLGGAVHALEPLVYAFHPEQVLLISEPAVCLGALWIPYRRDHSVMKSILKAGAESRDVGIIYCHADVRGAYMNDGMRSREGVEISSFPQNLPIYSGHFHKPHTMTKGQSSLRYVGSPYQTSLSEAGQDKFLYTMEYTPATSTSPPVWREEERKVLEVGKKYYKVISVTDPTIDKAKSGDRVVLPVRVGEDAAAEELLVKLKGKGVEVELRHERVQRSFITPTNITNPSNASDASLVPGVDTMPVAQDPLMLFADFMGTGYALEPSASNASTVSVEDIANVTAKQELHAVVVQEGRNTLLRLMNTDAGAGASAKIAGGKICDLKLEHVQLSNFGPFGGEKINYPLSQRGLVLIRGQSTDGTGADSNGAGKTTLAMSVMWGLTGSMDPRLVSDGKAMDVAFDVGSSSVKRTAEVSIRGQINKKPFEILRKRGARRADLSFVVDGKDLTTLAVKDTQALIDDTLGIGGGLLQRCCFFGQHSHTLQSLLGLTDVRLKSELSCLVDTELWSMSMVDVHSRERAGKVKLTELAVEARIRGEELTRSTVGLNDSTTIAQQLEVQLEEAKAKTLLELDRTRSSIAGRFGDVTVSQLTDEIEMVQREADVFQKSKLEPMRAALLDGMRRQSSAIALLDQEHSMLRERITHFRASALASNSSLVSTQSKIRQLDLQMHSLELTLKNLCAEYSKLARSILTDTQNENLAPESVNSDLTRAVHEEAVKILANFDVKLETASNSLQNLHAECVQNGPSDPQTCVAHSAEHCPTCGQALSLDMRLLREVELKEELIMLNDGRANQLLVVNELSNAIGISHRISQTMDQLGSFLERRKELAVEAGTIEGSKRTKDEEIQKLDRELAIKTMERADLDREWRRSEGEKEKDKVAAEEQLAALFSKESSLRKTLEELRTIEAVSISAQGQANATVLLFEERVKQARETASSKSASLFALEDLMRNIKVQEQEIASHAIVLQRLADVFGPRGIQHYVFTGVLKQLESIANSYLMVLAEGGVQLTLQGDEDADKIVKAVWVRSADGTMRERGLSQLSGGQWRRVSMALDLAFAEIIRRRGTLRSSLIVMDEVLTHLDASGREAVGSVLRAMVDGPRAGETMPDVVEDIVSDGRIDEVQQDSKKQALSFELSRALLGGGAYETAIVILQDLAAMELEEAFDHVDIVIKAADTSKVLIDGQRD